MVIAAWAIACAPGVLLKQRDETSSAMQELRRRAAETGIEAQRAIEAEQRELLRL